MTLRRRLLLIGGLLLVSLVGALYLILANIIQASFAELERESTVRDVQRVMNALAGELRNLKNITTDYAHWDDTYTFVEDGNQDYIVANFGSGGSFTNLRLNLVVIVQTTGEVTYGNSNDLANERLGPVPDALLKRLQPGDRLLQHPFLDGFANLLVLPEGPMLIASVPILTSAKTGPSHGTMIFGRYLSADEIERLGQSAQLPFTVRPLEDTQLPANLQQAATGLSADAPIVSQALNDETITGLGLLNDVDDKPALLLRIDEPRTTYQHGQAGLRYMAVALLAGGALFGLASLFFLERLVLVRVGQMTQTIGYIETQHDLSQRVPVTGSDEIAHLARSFNSMTAQLENSVELLEHRVETRTAQLRTSAEVGRAAASILDPDLLFKQAVTLIAERFDFYYVAVFTVDETNRWAILRECTGPGDATWVLKQAGHKLEIGGQSMVGTAIAHRQARIAVDVGLEVVRFANPLLPDSRSEIALPLIVGDRVLGALDVQSTQPAAFDETNATVLQSMADQIAVALNNAAQYRREQHRVEQTTGLLKAALEFSAQPDETQLADRIARVAMSILEADGAGVWFPIDAKTIELRHFINVGEVAMTGRRLTSGEGLSGQVFASGRTQRVDDYLAWPGRSALFADAPFHSAISVPMIWQGQVTGVLAITRSQPGHPFVTEDESIAQLVATQAAAALENLRLLDEQQRTLDEVSALNRRLVGEAWQPEGLGEIIQYEHRQHAADLSKPLEFTLEIPILLRDTPIGKITLQDEGPREFSDDERSLIDGVVQQMAIALENQRLISQTLRTAQREKEIATAADRIHRATDLDRVLRIAVEEISRITGAEEVGIQLGAAPGPAIDHGNGHESNGPCEPARSEHPAAVSAQTDPVAVPPQASMPEPSVSRRQ